MNEIEVFIDVPMLGGNGVPSGGTTGQVLTKISDQDGDFGWRNPAVEEAPKDGVMYGRVNGVWQPIRYASGLTVSLSIPDGVNPSHYTVVIRNFEDGTEKRVQYYHGFAESVESNKTIIVNVIPPSGCTAPVYEIFANTQPGFQYAYTGASERISDGIYIFDKFGAYTPWQIWNTTRNDDAVGVGYRSFAMSFVMSKKWASASSPTNGSPSPLSAPFGIGLVDASELGMVVDDVLADGYFAQNNRILLSQHEIGQPNWRTASSISTGTGANFAPAAAACARLIACEGDEVGSWGLGQFNNLKFVADNANGDFGSAYTKIKGTNDLPGSFPITCLPDSTGEYVLSVRNGATYNLPRGFYGAVKAFRPF